MSIAGILGFMFFYIAVGLIFYSLCVTAKQSDEIMEQQAKEYWSTVYKCKGGNTND